MKPFTPRERAALAAVCDTFVPRVDGTPERFLGQSASDQDTPAAVEEVVRTVLQPAMARDLRALLNLLDTPGAGVALGGGWRPFTRLAPDEREAFLQRLADSRIPQHRQAFAGLKRLVLFAHYARVDPRTGENPNWDAIGYRAPPGKPDPSGRRPLRTARVPAGGEVHADAVVVGSGAGGGVAAALLAQAGLRVIVVEAGGPADPGTFTGREIEGQRDHYEHGGALTTRDGSLTLLAGRTAGGGTTVNWLTSLEPPAWLRREWERAGITDAAGPSFEAHVRAVRQRLQVTTEESVLNGSNRVLRDGARKLGYEAGRDWRILPRNAQGCRNRCDYCEFGCPFDAKQSGPVTYLADAAQAGARFLFHARATRILVEGGRAAGVDVERKEARPVRIHAPTVIAAGGAVQTAALLLRSGVRHKRLGRLYVHPATSVAGRYADPVRMWAGPPQTVVVDRFADLDGKHHGALLEAVPGHPGLTASSLPWRTGAQHKRDMLDYAHTAGLLVLTRDRDPGRVTVDRHGDPVIRYRVSRRDGRHLVRGMRELARIHRAAGADAIQTLHTRLTRVEAPRRDAPVAEAAFDAFLDRIDDEGVQPNGVGLFSAHQMGTVPLGSDGHGVADPETGRVWNVEGLHVADGSAFPTPSGVNPMLTILALTHRNMTRLAHELKSRRGHR